MKSLGHMSGAAHHNEPHHLHALFRYAHFGFDELMEHGACYDRMEEFVNACRKL